MKKLSTIMYLLYATALILVLTFGTAASHIVIDWFKARLDNKEITDVVVSIDEDAELAAGKYHYIEYTAKGKFSGDAGLVFKSLDPDYLTVTSRGALYAKMTFEGDYFDGRIRITSKHDSDFEKIITVRFVKQYPDTFTASYFIKGYSYNSKTLFVGVPVYVYSVVPTDVSYNVHNYDVVYDKEYFDKTDDGALVPIKTTGDGEMLSFSVVYGNGATAVSNSFTIAEAEEVTEIDEIKINNIVSDEYGETANKGFVLTLFNDGKKVATDYTLTFEDESDVTKGKSGYFSFKTVGDKTVTVTLPNGFSKTVTLRLRNIIKAPVITNSDVQSTRTIKLLDTDVKPFSFVFDDDVTYKTVKYEYDKDVIQVSGDSKGFTITAKKEGVTALKLIVDDGVTRVEESFTVEVKEDRNLLAVFSKHLNNFVTKVLGHGMAFVILAFFAMNMFKYCEVENRVIRFLLYVLTGLPLGVITEYIQTNMPGRSGRIEDVVIDMTGFFIGTVIVLMLRKCIEWVRS